MEEKTKYEIRGVSATKSEVHEAIKHLDKGLYEKAFCKILPDLVGGDPEYCNIMHADTAGTKTSLAYMYWRETGDISVWRDIVQDAIVMNTDDMGCVGCVDNIVISSTIGRNKHLISGTVISELIQGASDFFDRMKLLGVNIHLSGGETADVGDIVRTIDVGYTTFSRIPRNRLVINNIRPGDIIVGLSSFGQASYESRYNSGIGSNGLTAARHDVLYKAYRVKYPEAYDPNTPEAYSFTGSKSLLDEVETEFGRFTVGQLLLSPTRTYLPVLKRILAAIQDKIHGLIHCTGGGQTKVLKFVEDVHIIKDALMEIPPVFRLIQSESGTPWREMYQVFNMGHRLEFYLPEEEAQKIINIAGEMQIVARIIGRVETAQGKHLTIKSPFGVFQYTE